jgi:hypothetical protein
MQLLDRPQQAFASMEIQIRDPTAVTVLANDAEHLHLVIPTLH